MQAASFLKARYVLSFVSIRLEFNRKRYSILSLRSISEILQICIKFLQSIFNLCHTEEAGLAHLVPEALSLVTRLTISSAVHTGFRTIELICSFIFFSFLSDSPFILAQSFSCKKLSNQRPTENTVRNTRRTTLYAECGARLNSFYLSKLLCIFPSFFAKNLNKARYNIYGNLLPVFSTEGSRLEEK